MKREEVSFAVGEKKAYIPIVQGGMGVGISLHRLAGTIAKEGGVGLISTAQIGFREKNFDRNPLQANLDAMGKELKSARNLAPNGIIGFNIMVAARHYEEYVREAVRLEADLIVSGAGLPTDLPLYAKGTKTNIAPIVSTEKSAHVILKYWDKKYGVTADMLVIEGWKAGGHLGFHSDELGKWDDISYETEIGKIIGIVRFYEEKYERKIPIILAGGMYSAKDLKRAKELGADGIQVGSRFVTTEECDADIRYKEAYLKAGQEDICIVKSPVGMPARAIYNTLIRRVENGEQIPHTPCHQCVKGCNPKTIPYCITDKLIEAVKGNVENGLVFCGAEVYRAAKIETVKEVIDSFLLAEECV